MNDHQMPAVNKIPFLVADLILLGGAGAVVHFSHRPLSLEAMALCAGLTVLGAIFSVIPFILEYKASVKLAESVGLTDTVAQIQNLEAVARQISGATAQWQDVQASAGKAATAAKEISAHMEGELKSFAEFVQKANDSEKGALRLEVEKLRRSESEWLQIIVRILDHIFALHQAGIRSGNAELVEQLNHFQNACRDAARRIGISAFGAAPDEPFDEQRHKLLGNEKAESGARVAETMAPGFTFQTQLLRPALVKLKPADMVLTTPPAPEAETEEPTLL